MADRSCRVCGTIPSDDLEAVCTACGEPLAHVSPAPDAEPAPSPAYPQVNDEWGIAVEDESPAIDSIVPPTPGGRTRVPLHSLPAATTRAPGCVQAIVRCVIEAVDDGRLLETCTVSPGALQAEATDGSAATPLRFVLDGEPGGPAHARYASPQCVSSGRDDRQLWWSLGLLLAEMLTGRHAWGGYPVELGDPDRETLFKRIRASRPALPTCQEPAWSAAPDAPGDAWFSTVFLVHSLAHADAAQRWGRRELAAWLEGQLVPPIIVGDMGVWDAQSLQDAAARYPTELARSLESVSSTLLRQIDPDFAQLVAELRVRRVQIDGGEAVTVCCTPASRLLPAAARMHADLASAAPTSRLGVLLRMSPPTRIVDAAEFLIRILHATPADGIVTRAEARYIERVAALRASGVPIDPLRIDPWLRASDTPDLELLQQFEAIRATYGATRFSALRHALEGLQPMFLEMLLVVGAEPSAIVSRAEVARRRAEHAERSRRVAERQWRETIAAADVRAQEAEALFAALLAAQRSNHA